MKTIQPKHTIIIEATDDPKCRFLYIGKLNKTEVHDIIQKIKATPD